MPNMQTIKDANGKEFQIDISKIADINGDCGPENTATIKDSALKNRINFEHSMELTDSKGNILDANKVIADMESGQSNIVALDVTTEATHSGKNHNYCVYYEDSMEKDAESFTNPFNKPVLKNHNDYSGEPLGRVKQAWFGPSDLTDERSAIFLKTRITDKDAIPKFIDGRYGTVSISGTMGTVTCNICGKTILKDGKLKFCGHWRGETYKDQMCYWGARDIEYHEVSTVNNPADDFAQITKVTVLTDKDLQNDNNKEENNMGSDSNNNVSVEDIVDSTLNNTTTVADANSNQDETQVKDSQTQDNNQENENTENTQESKAQAQEPEEPENNNEDNNSDNNQENTQEPEEPETSEDDSSKPESEDARVISLQEEVIDLRAQIETLNKALDSQKKETQMFKDRCVSLAIANKENVVDSIIEKENIKDEEKDARKQELITKSMKELKQMIEDSNNANNTRNLTTPVASPVLANDTDNSNNKNNSNSDTNADTNKANDNQTTKTLTTVDDAAQEVISRLFKN